MRRGVFVLMTTLAVLPALPPAAPAQEQKADKRAAEQDVTVQEQQARDRDVAKMRAELERAMAAHRQEMMQAQREAQEMARQMLIQPWANPWEADKDFDKVRVLFDMAQAQHEIIMLLIESGQFNDAVQESVKILKMGFPERYDLFLLNEIDEIVDQLVNRSQDEAAIKVLENGKTCLRHPEAKAGLLMQVARLHKKHNRKDLAIKTYREAMALQQEALSEMASAKAPQK